MKTYRLATISYNFYTERHELAYDEGGREDLHCGDCFEVQIGRAWKPTRIECSDEGWYLVGVQAAPEGLRARVGI